MREWTILVVEDDEAIRLGLQEALRAEGYRVLVAADGEEGLRRGLTDDPDLVVLDVMLPRMDGFEVLARLRADGVETPVLLLTARLDLGEDREALVRFTRRHYDLAAERSWYLMLVARSSFPIEDWAPLVPMHMWPGMLAPEAGTPAMEAVARALTRDPAEINDSVVRFVATLAPEDVRREIQLANSLGRTELIPDLISKLDSMDKEIRTRSRAAIDAIMELERLRLEARRRFGVSGSRDDDGNGGDDR